MNKFIRRVVKGSVVGFAGAAGFAQAATDTTAVTDAITAAGVAAGAVGAAVLVLHVGIKTYKYIRAAM